jgi:hypothetical protein
MSSIGLAMHPIGLMREVPLFAPSLTSKHLSGASDAMNDLTVLVVRDDHKDAARRCGRNYTLRRQSLPRSYTVATPLAVRVVGRVNQESSDDIQYCLGTSLCKS